MLKNWKRVGIFIPLLLVLCGGMVAAIIKIYGLDFNDSSVVSEHRLEWWLSAINWDKDRTDYSGKGVKIAVIDSGVDSDIPEISSSIIAEISLVSHGVDENDYDENEHASNDYKGNDYEGNDYVDNEEDCLDHGTAVTSIICANPENESELLGIATDAEIVSIDITDGDEVSVELLTEAIYTALSYDVDIINISLGSLNDSEELYKAIRKAYDAGVVITASAGNYMKDSVLFPAAYDEVLCVGSTSRHGDIVSPYGKVEADVIYMPGVNIVACGSGAGNYLGASGTSFSTPILTGVIALILEAHPGISNSDISEYFKSNTKSQIDVKEIINDIKED